jgi:hypothetical protein
MHVAIHANIVDQSTTKLADTLRPIFRTLADKLEGNYGGSIEHLWIDLELVEHHAKPDGSPRHSFRLQKRVSGRERFGLPAIEDRINVGHYSVRPDFHYLHSLPIHEAAEYVIKLIHESTEILLSKQKQLNGFDAQLFRSKLAESCLQLGFNVQ